MNENTERKISYSLYEQWKKYKEETKQLKLIRHSFMLKAIKSSSDKRLEPILQKLKDLGVIKSWYYNGTYHAC
jgi:hypothetical protein